MHAAVVTDLDHVPQYLDAPDPEPAGPEQSVVEVLASALHPRVRSQADGSHYTETLPLPFVPGIDGVGRDAEGRLLYFVVDGGAMAERAVIDRRASVVLSPAIDPVRVAAAMNPAMSSWIALRRRIVLPAEAHVAILGASGSAGRLAIEVARHLGAARVSAVARDVASFDDLRALGADDTVSFEESSTVSSADVVLDYVWGAPAAGAMKAIVQARPDRGAAFSWVQIGSVAGAEAPIPSAALRASGLRIVGSGQGSVSTRDIVAELPSLADFIMSGTPHVSARAVPLRDVESEWSGPRSAAARTVLVP
ncbi:zinc-binding alcohol dehydrogenase family protein [Cnuibacter physcomitrellae]|uniref:quinone oxidoreductase family protein n=1 Tax=Cnuibacter physcomitrellae TaxID=1619308 RepID=UPI002175DE23|nr:zinc-binding alcohol dehydrogenase family protein [Cnuibacter physcomitrellae]MCS5497025.1 zinc-binding alcohol dehydrogenase family protein [Cnuibacter physcomitrellae]